MKDRLYPLTFFYWFLFFFFVVSGEVLSATSFVEDLPVTTFNNGDCQLNLPLPDNVCQDFSVNVTGETGTLGTDVYLEEVRLIIDHTWDADLDIFLTSPHGQIIEITTDNGSGGDNYGISDSTCSNYTTFVSDLKAGACNTLPVALGLAPFIGNFLPEQNLSTFNTGTPNGTWTLNICDDALASEGALQYFEMVFSPFTCAVPNFIYTTEIDSTFTTLQWQGNVGCADTQLEYGPSGFSLGSGTIVNVGCPPYTLTGLLPNTDYEIYLSESCSTGGYSAASCPIEIATLCSPPMVTLTEDFEGQNLCAADCTVDCDITGNWFNVTGDDTDWLVNSGPTTTPNTGPITDADGNANGKYIYLETSCVNAFGWEAHLYSQCINVVAPNGDCHFSFNYMMNGSSVSEIKLQVTLDGQSWLNIWNVTGNRGQEWVRTNLDLSAYNGETVQFRFVTRKSFGSNGDTALDNLTFHGSTLAGNANNIFYVDNDGDGYGITDKTILSCFSTPPPNFASLGGDCNDSFSFINPGATESPCDNFDSNCNPSDDNLLPMPLVQGNSACSGETSPMQAQGVFFGQLYWYDAPIGGNLLYTGNIFSPPAQINTTSTSIDVNYFVEEVNNFGCISEQRAPVTFTILPKPETNQAYNVDICEGDSLDLSNYPFIDQHQTSFTLSYHTSLPPDASNELINSTVSPATNSVYFIAATTANNCHNVIPVSVNVKSVPQPVIVGSSTMCVGTTQTLSVYDNGPNDGPYTRSWSTGSTIASTLITAPNQSGDTNNYTILLTGNNGCAAEETIAVTAGNGIEPVVVTTEEVSTCGGNDGEITLNPVGGVAPFSYVWSGVTGGASGGHSGSFTINNLSQGAYSITITDSSGGAVCSTEIPMTVVNGPAAIVQVDSINNVDCHGLDNGGIYLSVFGTNPTYQWSDGKITEDAENLEKGMYSLTISDNSCQSILNNIEISEPDSIYVKPYAFEHASCAEVEDGFLEITIIGGTPNFEVNWSNGDTGIAIEDLGVGNYITTITDGNGCYFDDFSFQVTAPMPVETEIADLIDISCAGANDGTVSIVTQGGTAPYQALWSNGSNAFMQEDLAEGNYSVTVTDFNGCVTVNENITFSEPSPLSLNSPLVNNPSCAGSQDGLLSVMTTGGMTPYTFDWSNGVTSFANFNLVEGDYSVTITDAHDCVLIDSFNLTAPVAVNANYTSDDASCYGATDGSLLLQSQNLIGNTPFTFEWSTGATTENLENVAEGMYSVTVTDADNCEFSDTLQIVAEQPIALTTDISHPNCHGAATGQIALNAFGGMPFYSYNWSNGMTTEVIDNIPEGQYDVTITAADGCYRIEENLTVVQPDSIEFTVVNIDSVSCAGSATGQINLNVSGGLAPYNFTWNGNGSTTEDLSNVPAGNYILDVTDSNGCTIESPVFQIGEAVLFNVSDNIFSSDDIDCETVIAADSLELLISGGQAPYQILWDNNSVDRILYNVTPDEYTATVTDALGCEIIHTVKVAEERELLTLTETQPFADCDNTNQSVCIEVAGGLAPFFYLWNDTENGTTNNREICRNIPVGAHSVTVTDNYGCMEVLEIVVNNTPPLNTFTNPEDIQNVDCLGSNNGELTINVIGGNQPYDYYWENENGDSISINPSLTNLGAGTYFLTITDAAGCTTTDARTITEPATLITYTSNLTNNDCLGDAEGMVDLQVMGGVPPYDFIWTTGATSEDIENLPADFYGVTITDANDCVRVIDELAIEITEPQTALTLNDFTVIDSPCFEDDMGEITLDVLGGTAPYLYDWSDFNLPDSETVTGLSPGDYSCEVFDFNGCHLTTQSFTINEPTQLEASLVNLSSILGSAEIEIEGGTPYNAGGYLVNWSNGDTGTIGLNLPQGNNSVTVTDANDCTLILDFYLGDTDILNAEAVETFSISPNPTAGHFFVEIEMSEAHTVRLEVRDILGQVVYTKQRESVSAEVFAIDLTKTATGVYFVNLFAEKKNVGILKVVKQ